jgi:hypothetical protein
LTSSLPNDLKSKLQKSIQKEKSKGTGSPSSLAMQEIQAYEAESKKLDNDAKKQIIALREEYAKKMFLFLIWWSLFVAAIMICHGKKWLDLDSSVVITLLSTTIVQVISLVGIIVKGLFTKTK